MALAQSIMGGTAGAPEPDSQSLKKRKHSAIMGEQTERLAAENGANANAANTNTNAANANAANTNGGAAAAAAAASDDATTTHPIRADDKQRVLKLLEPFSREQLLEILTAAATQHDDVLRAIKAAASADVAHRKVFVRGLAWETSTERLTAAFALFGEVEEAAVIFDKASGKSRGYGFVTFADMDGAQRAVETQIVEIDGRRATCNLAAVRAQSDDHAAHAQAPYAHHAPPQLVHHANARGGHNGSAAAPAAQGASYTVYTTNMPQVAPPAPVYAVPVVAAPPPLTMEAPRGAPNDEADRKLFVRGLSWDTTDESLRAEFIKYGELVEASVVRERKTGKSKGFGFVTFRHRAAAAASLQQPHKIIDGRSVTCNLASLGRTTPQAGGPHQAAYMAPPNAYAPPQQPDMGGYAMYAQAPPQGVDPYRQQQYAYGGAPPPLPPAQQYYYPPVAPGHAPPQGRRQ